jgi:hypothetical protein
LLMAGAGLGEGLDVAMLGGGGVVVLFFLGFGMFTGEVMDRW